MVLKCKMCGGDVEIIEGTNTGKCLYCKSVMTLPNINNKKIINLYNRANDLRLANEFDKSEEIYEEILKIDNTQVEAHWGIVLCKYGVEYVDDSRDKTKVPTCHRTIPESILSDSNYKFIKRNATKDTLELYKKEAEQISKIQKRILEISTKENPYDIFICYKETNEEKERTQDSVIAQDIYDKLTKEGYKVFFSRITLEDKLGTEYEPYIYSALKSSRVMLVVGTSEENLESVWVKNEWSRYLEFMKKDQNKTLIPVYSKMNPYNLPGEFASLQAQNMDKIGSMQDLVHGVKKILSKPKKSNSDLEKKIEEASDGVRKLGDDKYEIVQVKERLPMWYYFSVVMLLIVFICIKISCFGIIFSFARFILKYQIFVILFTLIGGILKLCSKKTRKHSDIFIIISIVLEIISIFNLWTILSLPSLEYILNIIIGYIIVVIIELFLYGMNPKWHLDTSSKIVVSGKQKEIILKANKRVIKNFSPKSVRIYKRIYVDIILVATILVCSLIFSLEPSNKRNENVKQIKIIENTNFALDSECDYLSRGFASECYKYDDIKKGEIYTVIKEKESEIEEENQTGYNGTWYYVKNKFGVSGWIYDIDGNTVKELKEK